MFACAVGVPSASALPATFGTEGSGPGQMFNPRGIAVDQESGDVYVADTANNRIDKFGPEGNFLLAWGWGVADGKTEALQTCTATCFPGLEGSGAGQFKGVEGIAVDSDPLSFSHGDVYVADTRNNRVEKFGPEGEFLLMFGGEVDKTTSANVCTGESGDECGEGVPGKGPGSFQGLTKHAVAVDATTGTVYVGDESRVQRFSEAGAVQSEVAFSGAGFSENLAVDSAKDIYLKSEKLTGVRKYDPTGKELGAPQAEAGFGEGKALAVGLGDELFVNIQLTGEEDIHHVLAYSAEGEQLASFDRGRGAQDAGRGIAYSEHAKALYVLNVHQGFEETHETFVRILTPPPPGPLILPGSESASKVQPTTATLGAIVNPEGAATEYHFEYDTSPYAEGEAPHGESTLLSAPLDAVNEVQSVTVAATGGHFTLAFKGEPSVEILFSATAAEVEAALDGIPGLGAGQVALSGEPGGPWSVQFTGARAGEDVPELSPDPAKLEGPEPSAVVATTTPGFSLFDDRAASAAIEELQPSTLYHYRAVASNGTQTTFGPDQTFTTLPPVSIDATSVSEVDDKSARLEADLNPHGVASEYRFEYDTTPYLEGEASHGIKVPVPDESIGAGTTDTTVSNLIQGLSPSTTYHYRVIAHNALGEVQGPDHSFTTQGAVASTLPDGRNWEQVSPQNKHGAPLEPITEEGGLIQTAPGGGAFAYVAIAPIGGETKGVRSPEDSQLLSRRTATGWETQDITTPHEEIGLIRAGFPSEYQLFADDLSASVVEPKGATPLSRQTTERSPYRREADGEFVPLVTSANVPPETKFGGEERTPGEGLWTGGVEVITATPDLTHIVLTSALVLAAGFEEGFVAEGRANLYELSGGALRLISVLPDGKPAAEAGLQSGVGLESGGATPDVRGAISSDGGRVFFTAGDLYMRDVGLAKTLQLDQAQGGSGESGSGRFQAASSDGNRVFFTDTSRLTKDATATPNKPDLYMCEIAVSSGEPSCALSDLSVDHNVGEAANVQGSVSAIDATGDHVYFAARGSLTSTPNAQGEHAVAGGPNLYEYDTGANHVSLVAVLTGNDASDWNPLLGRLTTRSSPSGRFFTFMSQRSLTGYDNRDAHSGQPDAEVYLFDSAGGGVSCVSCNPTGARPLGVFDPSRNVFPGLLVDYARSWQERWLAGSIPGWTAQSSFIALYQSRYLSDSGRMFFNASDALVPQDTNKVNDVYQYEPSGVGSCTTASATFSPASDGCVSLISSGESKEESAFLDASENGDEVFFLTASRLTTSDVDGAFDVYDAHVCSSSSPCPTPPPSVPGCEGDACQSLSSPPTEITPGSLTYKGPGNATPPAGKAKAKPTRAQLLKQALKACKKKKKSKKNRVACERQARKRYGAKKASVKRAKRAAPLHAPSATPNPAPLPPTLPGAAPTQKAPLASPSDTFLAPPAATAGSAQAAEPFPWWHLTSRQVPAHIAPGGEGMIVVQAINVGNAPTTGKYEFSDALPPGLTLQEVEYFAPYPPEIPARTFNFAVFGYCEQTSSSASCSTESSIFPGEPGFLLKPVAPYEFVEMRLKVKNEGAEPEAVNEFTVSGGGVAAATAKRSVAISGQPAGFGVGEFTLVPEEEGGEVDTHAGSHPYQLTNTVAFNRDKPEPFAVPAPPRNLHFKLPPGQIGSATALPQCNDQDFAHVKKEGVNSCPSNTAIGVAVLTVVTHGPTTEEVVAVPIFNLTPAQGEPARFGFEFVKNPVILDTAVRSGPGEDYGVTVSSTNITEDASFISATATFWGVPGDPSHNNARSWGCLQSGQYHEEAGSECEPSTQAQPSAFLTLPTNCAQPFATTLEGVSWPVKASPSSEPVALSLPARKYKLADAQGNPLSLTGCNQLAFAPAFTAKPTSESASSPSGLDVNLNFDDEGLTSGTGVAQSQIKDTTVTLPEGLTINPSSGVGLGGCTTADYAAETLESPPGAGCPNDSKLGTVEIETPLLTQKIHGSLFVAEPYENPFGEPEHGHPGGTLIALYIVAKSPETGVLIKLAGKVTPDPVTGRLVTTFENNPQLPFSHFNFHFREGQQAPLITPPTCGSYAAQALLTPWSEPLQSLTDSSPFSITSGSGGGACPAGVPPFTPQIAAGTLSNTAGAFSPFHLHLTRTDGESQISSFSTVLPPGLAGILAGIPFCPEEDIAAARSASRTGAQEEQSPSCPSSSLLGHSQVGTGVGAVLAYTPGRIYLAGPYNGDPFSLVSVTSAVVGPFDLGTVVVRFGLRIDPRTAQVSVDPTASEPIPTIIDGIVTHVRDIRVSIDRPNFTLNPTSCEPMSIGSTLTSSLGQSATISSPFQAASCASLKFTPTVAVATGGKASKANGASLHFKIAYPKGAMGSQSWFNEAKFDIPKQLPARLTTIQKACLAATFETNRGACPSASKIGTAIVKTPVLPVPLTGPVYFVSYGGAKFPDAVLVLDGYGVHIELHGETFISGKTGVTSATFRNTPDVPFESIEVNVPTGPFSEFGANLPAKAKYNFCGQKLVMPTLFKAQNGLEVHQNTPVAVTGCPKAKKPTRAQKLKAALKACKKKRSHARRASCERAARKRYAPIKKKKK